MVHRKSTDCIICYLSPQANNRQTWKELSSIQFWS